MSDKVRQQYELLPYPARDPRDEAQRLIEGSPSHLLELNHYSTPVRAISRSRSARWWRAAAPATASSCWRSI